VATEATVVSDVYINSLDLELLLISKHVFSPYCMHSVHRCEPFLQMSKHSMVCMSVSVSLDRETGKNG